MRKTEVVGLFGILFLLLIGLVSAEKIEIDILGDKESYVPGESINFRIALYDDNLNQLPEIVDFEILNFYSEVISSGRTISGEGSSFIIPENAIQGYWGIIVRYSGIEKKELFSVGELEKINIELEGDSLIISNVGNVLVVNKQILISIGENTELALVSLEIGQVKKIRLTGNGIYDIKISVEGTEENTFEARGVSLTGNVIGLEGVKRGFWSEYPLVSLFLVVLVLVVVIVFGLKLRKSNVNIKIDNNNINKK